MYWINEQENLYKTGKQASLFDCINFFSLNMEEKNCKAKLTYIDLFSGAGGFSLGFDNEGFQNIFSVDNDKGFCETYKANFPKHSLINKDIKELADKEIKGIIGNRKVDVIIGGPPCQGFSIAGNIGRKFLEDTRNYLFKEFVRIVQVVKPDFFVMENVARLFSHNNGATKNEIINSFKYIGYEVECKILNSADFGVPQIRKRAVFIGSLNTKEIVFPEGEGKHKTVKEALSDLPELKSGGISEIPNHLAMNHSFQMLNKMKYIKNGGDRSDIPFNLRPKSGDVRKYIKYNSNKPAITITGDMRKVFHYSQNRALSVRELARLQSFPDNFIFKSNSISQQQQIGNAVPPLMAKAIAKCVREMVKNKKISFYTVDANFPKVNFIGNKEKITSWICDQFPEDVNSIFDAFSGGGSVSYEAKKRGFSVISNDILKINYLLSKALIENRREKLNSKDIEKIFNGKPVKGFMYKNYSNVLFYPEECMELDLYRGNLESLKSEYKEALALVLLRRSMVRKMPYSRFNLDWEKIKLLRDEDYSYKKYKRKRAYHNKTFREHFIESLEDYNDAIFDNSQYNKAYNEDIFSLLKKIKADIVYLDPPYTGTMNNYFGFYGPIDEYIESKKLRAFENNFMDKKLSILLFDRLFSTLSNFKYWVLSYNNNSYPAKNDLVNIIRRYSENINVIEKKHDYKVTGKKKKQDNKEYLFLIKNEKYV